MKSDDMEAIQSLLAKAEDDPDAVDWEDIDPYLSHDNNDVRARAVDTALEMVADHPERALDRKSKLLELATDEYIPVQQNALGILGLIVPERPEAFKGDVKPFIDAVTAMTSNIRVLAAKSFAAIAREYPSELAPYADELVEILDETYDQELPDLVEDLQDPSLMETLQKHNSEERQKFTVAQEVAANGLVEIARETPGALEGRATIVLNATTHSDPTVAGAAIDVIAELVENGYEVPEKTVARMEAALDIESEFVQARAIRVLGLLEATDSIEAIETIAAETEDDDLGALAEDTVEWLRGRADEQ